MAEYVETLLAPGETITMNARQHWVALIRFALQPILILIGAFIAFAIGMTTGDGGWLSGVIDTLIGLLTLGLFVVAIVWLPIQVVRWTSRRIVLTSRRVLRSDGVLRKNTIDAGLDKITDVSYRQTWLGGRLGYADLEVVTAAGAPIAMRELIGANEFKQGIMAGQEGLIKERATTLMTAAGAAGPALAGALSGTTEPLPAASPTPPVTGGPGAAVAGGPGAASSTDAAEIPKASTPDEITATLAQLADMRDAGTITAEDFETKKAELLDRL